MRQSAPPARSRDRDLRPRENMRSTAAACCCGWARRRGDRAIRRSGSCLGVLTEGHGIAFILLAVADEIEWPRGQAPGLAPMHQRVFLTMGDPDLAGAG